MLDDEKRSIDDYIQAAIKVGVEHMLCVSTRLETLPQIFAIAKQYPQISCSVGIHPTEVVEVEPSIDQLVNLANQQQVVAIGETGLDYYRQFDKQTQHQRFQSHISVAKLVNKPLIIHTRSAREDTIAILREENASQVGGVLHCFTETWEMAKQALAMGFYISFSAIVTFKNANNLQQIAKKIPNDRFLIETDAPFLAPVPHRGKQNEPAYVYYVAECLASLRGVSQAMIAMQSSHNYYRLFGKKK